jgi:hypothetical protein
VATPCWPAPVARLAHAFGDECLADGVVDLVRAGVIEVFAFEYDFRACGIGETFGYHERRGAPDEIAQECTIFAPELRIGKRFVQRTLDLRKRFDQNFGNETSAEVAEIAVFVRLHWP